MHPEGNDKTFLKKTFGKSPSKSTDKKEQKKKKTAKLLKLQANKKN